MLWKNKKIAKFAFAKLLFFLNKAQQHGGSSGSQIAKCGTNFDCIGKHESFNCAKKHSKKNWFTQNHFCKNSLDFCHKIVLPRHDPGKNHIAALCMAANQLRKKRLASQLCKIARNCKNSNMIRTSSI